MSARTLEDIFGDWKPKEFREHTVTAPATPAYKHPKTQEDSFSGESADEALSKSQKNITYISTVELDLYEGDPFRPYSEEQMERLVQSIKTYGILTPLAVRPKAGARHEVLAGRHRLLAARRIELPTVPCIIKQSDDAEAAFIVTESNLRQREGLLPSEKARAYKLQMEALKANGQSTEAYESPGSDPQLNPGDSHDGNSSKNVENKSTIYRYMRLNYLSQHLLDLVDSGKITIIAAEALSRLDQGEQLAVHQYFFVENRGGLTPAVAKRLHERACEVELNYKAIDELMKKSAHPYPSSLSTRRMQKYIPPHLSKKDAENYVLKALVFYNKNAPQSDGQNAGE